MRVGLRGLSRRERTCHFRESAVSLASSSSSFTVSETESRYSRYSRYSRCNHHGSTRFTFSRAATTAWRRGVSQPGASSGSKTASSFA